MSETWIDKAEERAILEIQGGASDGSELLEYSQTNRTIAGAKQARICASIRFAASYLNSLYPDEKKPYEYLNELCDIVEKYQLTLDGEQNSRRQFIRVKIAQLVSMLKGKGDKTEEIKLKN